MSEQSHINSAAYDAVYLEPQMSQIGINDHILSETRYASMLQSNLKDYSEEIETNKALNEQLIDVESKRYDLHWTVRELQTELDLTQKKYRLSHLQKEDLQRQYDEKYQSSKEQESTIRKIRKSLRHSQEKVMDLTDEILRLREQNKELKLKLNDSEIMEEGQSNLNKQKQKIIESLNQNILTQATDIDQYKQQIESQTVQLKQLRKDLQILSKKTNYLSTLSTTKTEIAPNQSSYDAHTFYYFLLKWDTMLSNMHSYNESVHKMIKMKTISLASIPKTSTIHNTVSMDIVELNQVLEDCTKFINHLRKEKHSIIKNHRNSIEKQITSSRKRKLLYILRQRVVQRQSRGNAMERLCATQYRRQCQTAICKLSNHSELEHKQNDFTLTKQRYFFFITFVIYKLLHSQRKNKKYQSDINATVKSNRTKLFVNIVNHRICLNTKSEDHAQRIGLIKWQNLNKMARIHEGYQVKQYHTKKQIKRKSDTYAVELQNIIYD